MASILGSRITPPNQDGNEKGCFCNIKAKKIYATVRKCGFTDHGAAPDYSKPPTCYLRRTREGRGEDSGSGPTGCCAGGSAVSWSASTRYRIVEEYDPRTCNFELKECSGTTQRNGSMGGHSGSNPCCICYGEGSYSGNWNGQATLSIQETTWGTKECQWKGSYTYHNRCSGGPQTGDVTGPLTSVTEETSYNKEFDYQKLEDLIRELFEKCKFDDEDLEWNQQREAKFEETEDGSNVEATCEEPEALFKDIWDSNEEEYRCNSCYGLESQYYWNPKKLTVEFYTDRRKEEERTWIQQAKAQFIPKTDHYWKIFIPYLFYDYQTGEQEKRDDFPIVCELVKATAGEKIDIDPPENPGHYVIMNCARTYDLSQLEWDYQTGKYYGCMEKKNFPKILEDL